jgi:hypothetical protein
VIQAESFAASFTAGGYSFDGLCSPSISSSFITAGTPPPPKWALIGNIRRVVQVGITLGSFTLKWSNLNIVPKHLVTLDMVALDRIALDGVTTRRNVLKGFFIVGTVHITPVSWKI